MRIGGRNRRWDEDWKGEENRRGRWGRRGGKRMEQRIGKEDWEGDEELRRGWEEQKIDLKNGRV